MSDNKALLKWIEEIRGLINFEYLTEFDERAEALAKLLEGNVLLPVEPNWEMFRAFNDALGSTVGNPVIHADDFFKAYAAMLESNTIGSDEWLKP